MSQTLITILLTLTLVRSEYIPPGPKYNCPKETDRKLLIHPCTCENGTDIGLIVRCRNAGLATMSVGLGNIAALDWPIEKLIIDECPIAYLHGPLLHKSKIYYLSIENTPIRDIDEYLFYGVNETLKELSITGSKLEGFPKNSFKVLGQLTKLTLDGHNIVMLEKDILVNSTLANNLVKLHITNGNISDVAIEPFAALKKLKTLDLHGNKLEVLKKNQFKGLREVELLDLSYNSIKKMEGGHLADLTKLGWLNVSHNQISEITRGMFARNTVLKVLHLNSNKIKKLDTNSFRGMRFLRRLYLQDNEITDVGRGTFSSIMKIGTIDLARNKLKKIDFQMFHQLNYAEIIDISQNNIIEIQKQAFKDIYLAKINISHNNISMIEPGSFENCANITVLDLSHNSLTNFSQMAFDINSYATEFNLAYNGFTQLNQIPLQNMAGIKVLNVSYNNLVSIPRNTFPKLYELHTVDVSHNQISEIFSAVFQNLLSLRYLNLSHNAIESIRPATFGTIPTLLELDLSHNNISDLARGGLAKLASCSVIDLSYNRLEKIFQLPISLGKLILSHNKIERIVPNTWPSMNALLHLDLSHNLIQDELTDQSFSGLLALRYLDLSFNMLTVPPWEALNTMSSLQYLYLMENKIGYLKKAAFGRLPTVFEVNLYGNEISDIAVKAFDGLLQLLDLNLARNNITKIPNEAFKGLVSLRTLDLSQNNIERIDNKTQGLLDDCLSLEKVNLSYNKISYISEKMFPENQYIPYKLGHIDLSHNTIPLLTKNFNRGTKRAKIIDVSYNMIEEIRKDVLCNLTSIESLNLSHNQIKDLRAATGETTFKLPDTIRSLKLSSNVLKYLPVEQISTSPSLKVLDLTQNNLHTVDKRIVDKIRSSGLEIYFEGNPLNCDCHTQPLKHHLNHLPPSDLSKDDKYIKMTCHEPSFLSNASFVDVSEDLLVCPEMNLTSDNFDLTVEPDLVFRTVEFTKDSIFLHWLPIASGDISNFQLFVRDSHNTKYHSEELLYTTRQKTLDIQTIHSLKDAIYDKKRTDKLEICVQAMTSDSKNRKWNALQCRQLPDNFDSLIVKKKAGKLSGKMFSWSRSNVYMLVGDSVLLTFCIFLGAFLRKLCDM